VRNDGGPHRIEIIYQEARRLPLALVGGFWLLYWVDYNLSVAAGVGFIALAGVAVEIGVVMLVYLNQAMQRRREQAQREQRGLTSADVRHAVVDGALLRVRPVMMTKAAIIIAGLLPIMLGGGTGSEVMRRIAAPMVGDMLSVSLLTLVVIPAVYLLWKEHALKHSTEARQDLRKT